MMLCFYTQLFSLSVYYVGSCALGDPLAKGVVYDLKVT